MKSIRAFVAIQPGESIRKELGDLQQRLKQTGADIRWVRPESIHLTLAFLGDLAEEQIELLKVALNEAVLETAFELRVAGTGIFGKLPQPRVLWAGIAPCPPLERLQLSTIKALHAAGVELDQKSFSAHLTLGRFKSPRNLTGLQVQLEKEQSASFGSITVHELQLIQSRLTSEGARYTVLHRVPLVRKCQTQPESPAPYH